MVKRAATLFNGITIAYAMAFVNAFLAVLLSFGLNLTPDEQAAIVGFVNASLVLLVHMGHRLGEAFAEHGNHVTVTVEPVEQPPTPPR